MLPAAIIFVAVYVGPGIYLVIRFKLDPWWVLPGTAVLLKLLVTAIAHWPPARWWPLIIAGQLPEPSAYFLSVPVEAWHNYLYSLSPGVVRAFVAALSFLLAQLLVRPDKSLERSRGP